MTSTPRYVTGRTYGVADTSHLSGGDITHTRMHHAVLADGPRKVAVCGVPVEGVTDEEWSPNSTLAQMKKCGLCVDQT